MKKFKNLFKAMNNRKKKDLRVRESDGKLMQENKVFIPNVMELKEAILEFAYCSTYTMHPGGTKMYYTIRSFYYWTCMKREMFVCINKCNICQQVKMERKKSFGLM